MIKKFKNFKSKLVLENVTSYEIALDLADDLDEDTIDTYYDKYFDMSVEDILDLYPQLAFEHIDDERFVEDFKDDEKGNRELSEFDEFEFKPYIENHLDDEKKKRIKKYYRDNQGIDDDIKSKFGGTVSINKDDMTITITNKNGKIEEFDLPDEHEFVVNDGDYVNKGDKLTKLYYDDNMLDDISGDEMKNIIEELNEEEEFMDDLIESLYDEYTTAKDIVENMYGSTDNMDGKEIMNWFYNYIDDDGIIEDYKSNEDFDYKKERISDMIERIIELQEEVLKANKKNSLKLAELFKDNMNYDNISDEYDFQKAFIESYVEENALEDDKEDIEQETASALTKLSVDYNFELHPDIKSEYKDHMYGVDANKFNI